MTLPRNQRLARDERLTDEDFSRAVCPHMPLDERIVFYVRVLLAAGVEVFESCEGGPGHAYPEPTVRFHGQQEAGWKAVAAAHERALPLLALRRVWTMDGGEPTGPYWEVVFRQAS